MNPLIEQWIVEKKVSKIYVRRNEIGRRNYNIDYYIGDKCEGTSETDNPKEYERQFIELGYTLHSMSFDLALYVPVMSAIQPYIDYGGMISIQPSTMGVAKFIVRAYIDNRSVRTFSVCATDAIIRALTDAGYSSKPQAFETTEWSKS